VLIERNGLAQADTATIDLDWVNVPFDPRIIRSAHARIVLGVVPAEEYEAGMGGANSRREDNSLRSVIQADSDGATEFLGFVDRWGVDYSENGDVLKLECRDMSAPIRDMQLNENERIDLSRVTRQRGSVSVARRSSESRR